MSNENVISISMHGDLSGSSISAKDHNNNPNSLITGTFSSYNSNGGEPPMNSNEYVTHQELELHTEKLLHHIDNKFAETNKNIGDVKDSTNLANGKANWILGILSSIIAGIVVALITKFL